MDVLEATHEALFWTVLAFLIVAAGYSAYWAIRRRVWTKSLGWGYWTALVFFDVQLAIGAALWISHEGWNQDLFLGVIHPLGMIVAAGVAHVAVIRASRSQSSKVFVWVGISMLAALAIVVVSAPRDVWP